MTASTHMFALQLMSHEMNKQFLVTLGGQTKPIAFEHDTSVTEELLGQVVLLFISFSQIAVMQGVYNSWKSPGI